MRLLGSKYPKRSVIWGNTQKIWRFKTGQLKTRKSKKSMLVKRYRDQRGKSRFVGKTKALKHSACLDCVIPFPVTKTIIVDVCVPAIWIPYCVSSEIVCGIWGATRWALASVIWVCLKIYNKRTLIWRTLARHPGTNQNWGSELKMVSCLSCLWEWGCLYILRCNKCANIYIYILYIYRIWYYKPMWSLTQCGSPLYFWGCLGWPPWLLAVALSQCICYNNIPI